LYYLHISGCTIIINYIYIECTRSDTTSHTWSFASMLKILDNINRSCCVDAVCTLCFNTSLRAKWMRYFVWKKNPTILIVFCFVNTNLYLFPSSINSEVPYLVYPPMKLFTACNFHAYHQNFKTFKRARKRYASSRTLFTIDEI
jgi:hypothetical protein